MNFREQISALLRRLADRSLTHQQISNRLHFPNANVVSMHLDPSAKISPYPLKRLQTLAEACGLDAIATLKLVASRARHHSNNPTELDLPTLLWLARVTVAALEEHRALHGGSTGTGVACA